jgi:YHS domain-containing protein
MCNSEDSCHTPAATHHHSADGTEGAETAECPVMVGNTVIKADAEATGLVRDYEGQRYWLCCASCGPLFDADPAKYAKAA